MEPLVHNARRESGAASSDVPFAAAGVNMVTIALLVLLVLSGAARNTFSASIRLPVHSQNFKEAELEGRSVADDCVALPCVAVAMCVIDGDQVVELDGVCSKECVAEVDNVTVREGVAVREAPDSVVERESDVVLLDELDHENDIVTTVDFDQVRDIDSVGEEVRVVLAASDVVVLGVRRLTVADRISECDSVKDASVLADTEGVNVLQHCAASRSNTKSEGMTDRFVDAHIDNSVETLAARNWSSRPAFSGIVPT